MDYQEKKEMSTLLKEFDEVFKNTPGKAEVKPFKITTGDVPPIATYPRKLPQNGSKR